MSKEGINMSKFRKIGKLFAVILVVSLILSQTGYRTSNAVSRNYYLTKSVSSSEVKIGEEFKYELKLSYFGFGDTSGLKMVDVLPDNVEFVSTNEENYTLEGNTLTFMPNGGEVTDGSTIVVDVTVRFKKNTPVGYVAKNDFTVYDENLFTEELEERETSNEVTTKAIVPETTWQVSKKALTGTNPAVPEEQSKLQVWYEILVRGDEFLGLYDVALADTLPPNYFMESYEVTDGITAQDPVLVENPSRGGNINLDLGDIGAGEGRKILVKGYYTKKTDSEGNEVPFVIGDTETNTVIVTPKIQTIVGDSTTLTPIEPKDASATVKMSPSTYGGGSLIKKNRNGTYGSSGNGDYPYYDRYKKGDIAKFEISSYDASNKPINDLWLKDELPKDAQGNLVLNLREVDVRPVTSKLSIPEDKEIFGDVYVYDDLEETMIGTFNAKEDNKIVFDSSTGKIEISEVIVKDSQGNDIVFDIDKINQFKVKYRSEDGLPLGIKTNMVISALVTGDGVDSDDDGQEEIYKNIVKYSAKEYIDTVYTANADFQINGGIPLLKLTKVANRGNVSPTGKVIYTITYANDIFAGKSADIKDLVFHDIITAIKPNSEELAISERDISIDSVQAKIIDKTNQEKVAAVSHNIVDVGDNNYKIDITNDSEFAKLEPGEKFVINIEITIDEKASYGYIKNEVFVRPKEEDEISVTNPHTYDITVNTRKEKGILDLDSSLDYLYDDAKIFVNFKKGLSSKKYVHGDLDGTNPSDPDYWKTGINRSKVVEGGTADYKLTVFNEYSNGPITDFVIVDKLPDVNDTKILTSKTRGSKWKPILVNKFISYKVDVNDGNGFETIGEDEVVAYFSTKANPNLKVLSKSDFTLDETGSNTDYGINGGTFDENADWNLNPPADITKVKWLMFKYHGIKLEKESKLSIEWKMKAPVDAPIGEVATNSFAYGGTYLKEVKSDSTVKGSFLPSEPNLVRHQIVAGTKIKIGDRVWEDINKNGIQEDGEPGVNGILVLLYNGAGQLVNYTRTADNADGEAGYYKFPEVISSNYTVKFGIPDSSEDDFDRYKATIKDAGDDLLDSDVDTVAEDEEYVFSGTQDIVGDNLKYRLFTAGEKTYTKTDEGTDFGIYKTAVIGDYVWYDANDNGLQDKYEESIENVIVQLINADDDSVVKETITGENGHYSFIELDPGQYKVKFINMDVNFIPSKHIGTRLTSNSDIMLDQNNKYVFDKKFNDGNPYVIGSRSITDTTIGYRENTTEVITLLSGSSNPNIDAGYKKGYLGNRIFEDKDKDGKYQESDGDTLLQGIKIFLANHVDGADTPDKADFLQEYKHRKVSANNGWYGIRDIDLGNYDLWFFVPEDEEHHYVLSKFMAYDPTPVEDSYQRLDNLSSDNDVVTEIEKFDQDNAFDLGGTYKYGVIKNIAINDLHNRDYKYDVGLYVPGKISGKLFEDKNYNDINDDLDNTIKYGNAILYKKDENDNWVKIKSLWTSDGSYKFEDLDPGDYKVGLAPKDRGFGRVAPNKGNDANVNSDIVGDKNDDSVYLTKSLKVESSTNHENIDGGFRKASIGNEIYEDMNGNGIREDSEPLIGNVKVELVRLGATLATTTSSVGEKYYLKDISEGSYQVKFTLPDDSDYVLSKSTPKVEKQSEVLDKHNYVNKLNVKTFVWAFADGSDNAVSVKAGEQFLKVDLGLVKPTKISGYLYLDKDYDKLMTDEEKFQDGTVLSLYTEDGKPVIGLDGKPVQTTVDENAYYEFDNVLPGEYRVVASNTNDNYDILKDVNDELTDEGNDSEIERQEADNNIWSKKIEVQSGSEKKNINFGFKKPTLSGGIYSDPNGNGLLDAGDKLVDKKPVVTLLKNVDGSYEEVSSADIKVNPDGTYEIRNLDIYDEDSKKIQYAVKFALPDSKFEVSEQKVDDESIFNAGKNDSSLINGFAQSTDFSINKSGNVNVDAFFFEKRTVSGKYFMDKNNDGLSNTYKKYNELGELENANELEPGISGMTVMLYKDGNKYKETKTGDEGGYIFTDLPYGKYYVVFTPYTEDSHILTKANVNNNAYEGNDSDGEYVNKSGELKSYDFTIGSNNETETNVDVGFFNGFSVMGKVFLDKQKDGLSVDDELYKESVKFSLLMKDGSEYVPAKDLNGNDIESVLSKDGVYRFDRLPNDASIKYKLKVGKPSGYDISPSNQGDDDTVDSDFLEEAVETNDFTLAEVISNGATVKYHEDLGLFSSGGADISSSSSSTQSTTGSNPSESSTTGSSSTTVSSSTSQTTTDNIVDVEVVDPPTDGKVVVKVKYEDGTEEIIEVDIDDDLIAEYLPELPKTGGIPFEGSVLVGLMVVAFGTVLKKKKK